MQPAVEQGAKTKTVLLKKGMKFSAIVSRGDGKKGKVRRERFIGPCEVQMTAAQIVAFKDLLQTAPQVTVVKEPEPEGGLLGHTK